MFNPQRKSKLADIYMEERAFQLHLQKMQQIKRSTSPISARLEEDPQRRYLQQIHLSKLDLKARKSSEVYRENHRIFLKLMEADRREEAREAETAAGTAAAHPHHHHYYNQRNWEERVRQENTGMINRLVNRPSDVPTLAQMKRDFSQSQRYGKMVRKLPAILKHEQQFKRDLSLSRLDDSQRSLTSSRQKLSSQRAPTQEAGLLQPIEQALLDHK